MKLKELVQQYGQPYSVALGVDLKSRKPGELSKWFLAALLYAKPIRESSATKTYKVFEAERRTSAKRILDAGWDELVRLLDAGGYTRYDFSTADKLLEVFGTLQKQYGGDLNKLHAAAADSRDLEGKLKALGKGIGDVTVSIFLRDLRRIWPKADPVPTPAVRAAMRKFKITDLKQAARKNKIAIVRLETALLRLGRADL